MTKKALLSLIFAVVMLLTAIVPSFAAAQRESVQKTETAVSASMEDDAFFNRIAACIRDFFARVKALLVRIFPCLKDSSVRMYPTENVRETYGEAIAAVEAFAYYGVKEVEATPLADVSFDDIETLGGLSEKNVGLSDAAGARLITGRFGLRRALEFTSPETYLTLPDMGAQDALTISLWVNVKDLQTRANTDEPRVSTLLDTATGAGRVTLRFVHTGTPSYEDKATGEAVMGTNSTKLVFCVQGNTGGQYAETLSAQTTRSFITSSITCGKRLKVQKTTGWFTRRDTAGSISALSTSLQRET